MNILKDYPQIIAAIIAGIFALICKWLEIRTKDAASNPSRGFSGWLIIIAAAFAVILSLYSVAASRSRLDTPRALSGRTGPLGPLTGPLSGHVKFVPEFTREPKIMVALGAFDGVGASPGKWQLTTSNSDKNGFDYAVQTVDATVPLGRADVIWMAVGD